MPFAQGEMQQQSCHAHSEANPIADQLQYQAKNPDDHLDFSLDIAADPQWDSLHYARGKIVVASRLGQKAPPLDGVAVRFDDAEIVAGEARRAREMGFGGKLLIHPKQIAPAKAVFRPSDADYEWAQRVMTAAANSASAVQLDGAMVDVPVIKRAEAIIRDYEALV